MIASIVHILPTLDLIEHERTDECPCGPHLDTKWQAVDVVNIEADGSMTNVGKLNMQFVVHHSLDDREATGASADGRRAGLWKSEPQRQEAP